ncbi:MAG: hypothetical protein Q9181_000880 [Wetmoreana brouardii]
MERLKLEESRLEEQHFTTDEQDQVEDLEAVRLEPRRIDVRITNQDNGMIPIDEVDRINLLRIPAGPLLDAFQLQQRKVADTYAPKGRKLTEKHDKEEKTEHQNGDCESLD